MKYRCSQLLSVLLFATLGSSPVFAQYSTATKPDCGKYATIQLPDSTYSCERYATFPWFAAGQSWTSQVFAYVAPVPRINGQVRGADFFVGLGPNAASIYVAGGIFGGYQAYNNQEIPLPSSSSARLDLLDSVSCTVVSCYLDGGFAVGPLWIAIDAPDVQTLESANSQLLFLLNDPSNAAYPNGILTRQVAVPAVYNDQAGPNWASSFSETPQGQTGGVNDNFTSFAVTNLSTQVQSVTVYLYDQSGNLIAQRDTPALAAGLTGDVYFSNSQFNKEILPGGYYADTLASFFGLTTGSLSADAAATTARTGTIDGTIVMRSSGGQPIVPLIVRTVGASVTLVQQVTVQ